MFSLTPGAPGPWLNLQEMLRQRHAWRCEERDKEIAYRTSLGVPLDDDRADWRAEVVATLEGDWRFDRAGAVATLERALAIAEGGLQPLAPYKENADLAGVDLRVRSLSKADVIATTAALAAAPGVVDEMKIWSDFLRATLVGLRADFGPDGSIDQEQLDAEQLEAAVNVLDRSGLLPAVYAAAREYQTLSPLRRRGFGLPHPQTSHSSVAASASQDVEQPSAASATHQPPSSAVRFSRPDAALSATSSTTPRATPLSAPPSISGAPAAAVASTVTSKG